MDFQTAVRTCLAKYADFNGRALRSEYWWFYLAIIGVYVLLALLLGGSVLGSLLTGVFALGVLLPSLAAGVRRLHDTGRSGWFLLLGLIPFVNFYLLYLLIIRGDEGPNEYGPPPMPRLS
jgi:uncharacterized membrane protein YhaH (DUF805 family)